MLVSFVISTFNRRDVLLSTLARIETCGLAPADFETIVVDNASPDGTADAVNARFAKVELIRLRANRGSCAKNYALSIARGRFIVFLDDDSYPISDSIPRMLKHFDGDRRLGAAGFNVSLPDGSRECSAYPNVFIGCGVGLRREALDEVGALPHDYFMQAEEYDLSLRLLNAGWAVNTFDDLSVAHLKTPCARVSARTMRLDVRNNLTLIGRRFPRQWLLPFAVDWMTRYHALAKAKGLVSAYWQGLREGAGRMLDVKRREPVSDVAFETFAKIDAIRERFAAVARQYRAGNVLFIDYGKNILPYWLAARDSGVNVVAVSVADGALAHAVKSYRGVPVITDSVAIRRDFNVAIVSNLSPIHAAQRRETWRRLTERPVIDLFEKRAQYGGVSRLAA